MRVLRNKAILTLIGGILCSMSGLRAQQHIPLTQHVFNSLAVNPAYTAYKEVFNAQLGLRSQWVSTDGAPKTGLVSLDGVLDPVARRHGVGLLVAADALGAQSATSIFASYALRLQLDGADQQRLALGISGGTVAV